MRGKEGTRKMRVLGEKDGKKKRKNVEKRGCQTSKGK